MTLPIKFSGGKEKNRAVEKKTSENATSSQRLQRSDALTDKQRHNFFSSVWKDKHGLLQVKQSHHNMGQT